MTEKQPAQWLSPTAFERLQREFDRLTTEGRREVSEQIRVAREHGDISENADYDAAKERQGLMEARIRELEFILKTAVVVDPADQPASTVRPGMVVKILREATGSEETYLVGSPENRSEGVDVVSPVSPLGKALVGRAAGEVVQYDAPVGKLTVKVLEISPYEG
jgi:transcription elongation factor GreA